MSTKRKASGKSRSRKPAPRRSAGRKQAAQRKRPSRASRSRSTALARRPANTPAAQDPPKAPEQATGTDAQDTAQPPEKSEARIANDRRFEIAERLAAALGKDFGATGVLVDHGQATHEAIHSRASEVVLSEGFSFAVVQQGGGVRLGFSAPVVGATLSIGRARDLAASLLRVAAAAELTGLAAREVGMIGIPIPVDQAKAPEATS